MEMEYLLETFRHHHHHRVDEMMCLDDERMKKRRRRVPLPNDHFESLEFVFGQRTHDSLNNVIGAIVKMRIRFHDEVNKARDTQSCRDSEDSTVTYTEVSSLFEDLSDIGSLGVVGPEQTDLPDFVLEPVYPEFMPPEDEVLPVEEQPLPAAASPTGDSPGYVPESDPEEESEEDDDEDPEEDPADYPVDGRNDGDDEDESSDDDEDDDVDIEGDEKEEEEHPAVDHAPSAEETEPFETDESAATPPPHPAYRITARMSIRDEPPTPFWFEAEIARLLATPSPPPSPLSPWSSPLPQIPSSSLPVSPLPPPASPTYPLGYRAALIRRDKAPSIFPSTTLPSPIVLPRCWDSKASIS
ncbi:hypothetical protein Tco_0841431 [Tanacetum coccineum]|uniref:Uncharacterized protein n=1 Tax=Tanacetum coccineum TaxID=301880 RepID=A0ABQ5B200_9ASTR